MSRTSDNSIEILPSFAHREQLDTYTSSRGIDRKTLREARTSPAAHRKIVDALRKAGQKDEAESLAKRLMTYDQEFDRRATWTKRSAERREPEQREVVRKTKSRRALLLLLPAAIVAGLGVVYSGLGKSLLAALPDYSAGVARVGREGALPAAPGMRLEGGGQHDLTPPSPPGLRPGAAPIPPPMGGAGTEPF